MAENALVLLVPLLLLAGCGAKGISVGSVPFPANTPVFLTSTGERTAALPPASEPVRLVFFDAPWCPQCADVWRALQSASSTFPPGSVRIYRVLFDREKHYARDGIRDVAPIDPSGPPDTTDLPSPAAMPAVTTLTVLPGPFRDQFRVDHVPLLLFLDEGGTVEGRWAGYSPGLRDQVAEAVRRGRKSPLPTGK